MTTKLNILVIGGCRSGKSTHALDAAESIGERRIFVATCVPQDDEMQARVNKHREDRDDSWKTLEIPVEIADAVAHHGPSTDVILVDCLTLWLNNLMMETRNIEEIQHHISALAEALKNADCSVVLVSNEVGSGIGPQNAMARLYRDLAGWANQAMANVCDKVVWTVAGIPVTIKPSPTTSDV